MPAATITTSTRSDQYAVQKKEMRAISAKAARAMDSKNTCGLEKAGGKRLSKKVLPRLMKQEQLQPVVGRKRAYSSYRRELTPVVPNIIDHHFYAQHVNEKCLTDITKLPIPAGKIYLPPTIDCFNGMTVCWSISTSPNVALVNSMLDAPFPIWKSATISSSI